MNLQSLVPPWELCQLIPKGEFEDSALVWREGYNPLTKQEYIGVSERYIVTPRYYTEYPAPTLQEILEDLPRDFEFSRCYEDNVPTEKYITIIGTEIGEVGNNGAESAMKTWLNIKGINNK